MNLLFGGLILLFTGFVILWIGEYLTRILEMERLLIYAAKWTDPVRHIFWHIGFLFRDCIVRLFKRIDDLLAWVERIAQRFWKWFWPALQRIWKRMKLSELAFSFLDTCVFFTTLASAPFQLLRGFFNLPFREFSVILYDTIKNLGSSRLRVSIMSIIVLLNCIMYSYILSDDANRTELLSTFKKIGDALVRNMLK